MDQATITVVRCEIPRNELTIYVNGFRVYGPDPEVARHHESFAMSKTSLLAALGVKLTADLAAKESETPQDPETSPSRL